MDQSLHRQLEQLHLLQIKYDTTLDTAGGLIAEYDGSGRKYPTTLNGSSAAVYTQAGGGDAVDVNDTFPKGITIFGRWTEIDIAAGSIIAYVA